MRKSHTTIMRHQGAKQSKTTSSLFPIEMIAKLEWTQSNAHQNIEQLQNPNISYLMQLGLFVNLRYVCEILSKEQNHRSP